MKLTAAQRRRTLINLLKIQALIGAGFVLWIFFAGDSVDERAASEQRFEIDTTSMPADELNIVTQRNFNFVIIKPSPQALQQLATLSIAPKATTAEPPRRDNRVDAAIKVFALARVEDHYLLSGRDHWQRDQVCDDLQLQRDVTHAAHVLDLALVCRQSGRSLAYDVAGRSLQADIADLEMPAYRLQNQTIVIDGAAR